MAEHGRAARGAAALTVTAVAIAGCSGKTAAESLAGSIEQVPGVISSTMSYETTWWGAARRFDLNAVLADTATPDQAEQIGRTFTEQVDRDLAEFDAVLTVDYRVSSISRLPLTSTAAIHFTKNNRPPSQAVTDSMREWLNIAQSPGVQSAGLTQPADGGPADSRTLRVTVARDADDDELRALVGNHPDLKAAKWVLVGGSPTQGSPTEADYPEAYTVTGAVPDEKTRQLWDHVVSSLGEAGTVEADTDLSRTARNEPPTNVVVNFPSSRNREDDVAQAWLTLPLLQGLPQPARVDFDGDTFTMGGCSGPDEPGSGSKIQAELQVKFERC